MRKCYHANIKIIKKTYKLINICMLDSAGHADCWYDKKRMQAEVKGSPTDPDWNLGNFN